MPWRSIRLIPAASTLGQLEVRFTRRPPAVIRGIRSCAIFRQSSQSKCRHLNEGNKPEYRSTKFETNSNDKQRQIQNDFLSGFNISAFEVELCFVVRISGLEFGI